MSNGNKTAPAIKRPTDECDESLKGTNAYKIAVGEEGALISIKDPKNHEFGRAGDLRPYTNIIKERLRQAYVDAGIADGPATANALVDAFNISVKAHYKSVGGIE